MTKKRSLSERVEAHERKIIELRDQLAVEMFEQSLKSGDIKRGKQSEFRMLMRELKVVQKAKLVALRRGLHELQTQLSVLQDRVALQMRALVKEG